MRGGHKLEVTFFDPLIFYFFIGGAKKCKLGGRENVTYIFWRGGPPYLFVTYIFWPPPKKKLPKGVGMELAFISMETTCPNENCPLTYLIAGGESVAGNMLQEKTIVLTLP